MLLSLVIPCYNEANNLPLLLCRLRDALRNRTDVELILVNNGSTDNSALVLRTELAKPENGFARGLDVPVNQGYGFGILSGLRVATGDFLAWTHADLQTDPNDALLAWDRLIAHPRPEGCLARGRRRGRPRLDRLFTAAMGWTASLALQTRLYDINAQPKVFSRQFFKLMEATGPPADFSLDLFALYLAAQTGMTLLEQPASFGKRLHGEAKGGGSLRGKLRLSLRTWKFIFKLRRRSGVVSTQPPICTEQTVQPHPV